MTWISWKRFVKEFIFSKILELLPVALLKKTSFMKSVLVCWNRYLLFYENIFGNLVNVFFLIFFSTSWLHFYFTGYLIMYWWKRSLWWQEGLQGNEDTRGVSEFCLFKGSFCWAIKWVECLIFHFIFTLQIKKKKKLEFLGFRKQIYHWNVLIVLGYW